MMVRHKSLTPREIVSELDKYIVGQKQAKRAVAIALRNRYRRSLLDTAIRDEIVPKNILMIGPTGVGKTEIARRLAKLVGAPFIKIEATKFTEVGYVGRDVESMVRDLIETSIRMVKNEKTEKVKDKAEELANDRIVEILVPMKKKNRNMKNPLEMLFGGQTQEPTHEDVVEEDHINERRRKIRFQLLNGQLEDEVIEIEVEDNSPSMLDIFSGSGVEQMGLNMQDVLGNLIPKKPKDENCQLKKLESLLFKKKHRN